MFGSPETTTGGNALKFYASVRLDVRRIGSVKAGDAAVGNRTRVKVVKNKLAPPFRQVEFDIRYGIGIDTAADLLDKAVEAGVIDKNGAYYALDGVTIGQGRERARAAVHEDPALASRLRAALGIGAEADPSETAAVDTGTTGTAKAAPDAERKAREPAEAA